MLPLHFLQLSNASEISMSMTTFLMASAFILSGRSARLLRSSLTAFAGVMALMHRFRSGRLMLGCTVWNAHAGIIIYYHDGRSREFFALIVKEFQVVMLAFRLLRLSIVIGDKVQAFLP